MEACDLFHSARVTIESVGNVWEDAVVLVDKGAADVLHSTLGAGYFLNCGARAILALEDGDSTLQSSSCDAMGAREVTRCGEAVGPSHKAVFVVATFLGDAEDSIKRVLRVGRMLSCCVLCMVSEAAHMQHPTHPTEENPYLYYSSRLRTWMVHETVERDDISVVVQHLALPYALIGPDFFLFPSASRTCTRVDEDKGVAWHDSLDDEQRVALWALSSALATLFGLLGVKVLPFALGKRARFVCKGMMSQLQPKGNGRTVSLIIVDRALDLVGPTSHTDSLLDRVFQRSQRRGMDVVAPMPGVYGDVKTLGVNVPLGACVCHPNDQRAADLLRALAARKEKDAMREVRKLLVDTFTRESLAMDPAMMMGNVSVKQLKGLLEVLERSPSVVYRNLGVLELAHVVVDGLERDKIFWGEMTSAEKVLQMSVLDPTQSLPGQLVDLLHSQTRSSNGSSDWTIRSVLQLAIHMYSLKGVNGFEEEEEHSFCDALMETLLALPTAERGPKAPLHGLQEALGRLRRAESSKQPTGDGEWDTNWGGEWNDDGEEESIATSNHYAMAQAKLEIRDRIDEMMATLRSVSQARKGLLNFRSLIGDSGAYSSLVRQLLSSVVDERAKPPSDLEALGGSIKDFLSRGLGSTISRLGLPKQRSCLADQGPIFLFVIGGACLGELRDVHNVVANHPRAQVFLGSTHIATPNRVFDDVIGS